MLFMLVMTNISQIMTGTVKKHNKYLHLYNFFLLDRKEIEKYLIYCLDSALISQLRPLAFDNVIITAS